MEVQQPLNPQAATMEEDLQLASASGLNANMDIDMDLDLGPIDGMDDMQLVR